MGPDPPSTERAAPAISTPLSHHHTVVSVLTSLRRVFPILGQVQTRTTLATDPTIQIQLPEG